MMIHGVLIFFLGTLPPIVANPLPVDSIDSEHSNQLLSNYLDPTVLPLVPDLGNQGSLPSVGLGTLTHDPLESVKATYPAIGSEASADVCENEGLQPVVQTNTKLRKRQGGFCASQFKGSQPSTITPPTLILLPEPEENLLNLPTADTGGIQCKKPFVNRYCCDGPLGNLLNQITQPAFPYGFYDEVHHCLHCKFLWNMNGWIFLTGVYIGTAMGCLSPAKDFCCVMREVAVLHAINLAIFETESWLRISFLRHKEITRILLHIVVFIFTCRVVDPFSTPRHRNPPTSTAVEE